jgi:hypothetical protein
VDGNTSSSRLIEQKLPATINLLELLTTWGWKPQTPLEAIWTEIADHAERHPDWLDATAD